jgi:cation:H+ antiporter
MAALGDVALIGGGLVLLIGGGELLVRGAVQAAERLGVSPLLIGLTLVGFGTSTPELVTSVQASLIGSPGIAVGNIVGSNIANILVILGISAVITPVAVASSALKRDGTIMLATAVLLAAVSFIMPLDRLVGATFVALLVGYLWFAIRTERLQTEGHGAAYDKAAAVEGTIQHMEGAIEVDGGKPRPGSLLVPLGIALAGLVLVVFGGRLLVQGAVALARDLGISETVIGLTIVAIGTSMPELVTSVIAALRKQSEVAIGNVIGSNIYNVLGIGGVTALIAPTVVPPEIARFDNLVMVGVSALCLLLAWTGSRVQRWEGAVLLAGYGLYLYAIWPK